MFLLGPEHEDPTPFRPQQQLALSAPQAPLAHELQQQPPAQQQQAEDMDTEDVAHGQHAAERSLRAGSLQQAEDMDMKDMAQGQQAADGG
eukprot:scaffold236645_cov16-Tisochrysis_lutea.AAC.3